MLYNKKAHLNPLSKHEKKAMLIVIIKKIKIRSIVIISRKKPFKFFYYALNKSSYYDFIGDKNGTKYKSLPLV